MKLALIHDDLIQYGGAERLFKTMMDIWPEADVYTSMSSQQSAVSSQHKRNKKNNIPTTHYPLLNTSFMQLLPFKKQLYRFYFPLYPLAFESFDLSNYDVAISSSTRFAHYIITKPSTIHICYINTPPRMFWEPEDYFQNENFWGLRPIVYPLLQPILSFFRMMDHVAGQRPDYIIANSKTPADRIKKYYSRTPDAIIYPFYTSPIRHPKTNPPTGGQSDRIPHGFENYFLIVSRLVAWKQAELAVQACNKLKLPLIIIGDGPNRHRLEKLAGPTIKFLGYISEEEKFQYLQNCQALIFPQKEDFGIVPLEAMACGKPVIAFAAGGALETIIDGETGMFFQEQAVESLVKTLKNFEPEKYSGDDCISQAQKFSKERFVRELREFVEEKYEEKQKSKIKSLW